MTNSAWLQEAEDAVVAGVGRRSSHLLGVTLGDAASESYMVRMRTKSKEITVLL